MKKIFNFIVLLFLFTIVMKGEVILETAKLSLKNSDPIIIKIKPDRPSKFLSLNILIPEGLAKPSLTTEQDGFFEIKSDAKILSKSIDNDLIKIKITEIKSNTEIIFIYGKKTFKNKGLFKKTKGNKILKVILDYGDGVVEIKDLSITIN